MTTRNAFYYVSLIGNDFKILPFLSREPLLQWKIDKDRCTYDAIDGNLENDNRCGHSGDIEDTADNNFSGSRERIDKQRMSWSEIALK